MISCSSFAPHDPVEAIIAIVRSFLVAGGDNADCASPQFDVTDFQARRLHRLPGTLDIVPAKIAWRVRHNERSSRLLRIN
jgi:hypothetical protein